MTNTNYQTFTKASDAPKPLYEQVKSYVLGHVQSGDWPVHYQIPSEHTLVKELKMSRMTIHRALRELTQEGHLKRMQGVGTFVAQPQQKKTALTMTYIQDTINSRGNQHICDIHFLQSEAITPDFAIRLGLKEGDQAFRSYFVHRENGIPIMLEDRYTNPAIVPDFLSQDFSEKSVDQYFMDNCSMISQEHQISATLSTPEFHHFMELDQAVPCLSIDRRTWSGNRIISVARLLFPGHRFQLTC
ncbi:MAG: histidine utilization repressor [Sneathiella sp.]|nr:histidine utilization repressor [Sneathiella sp.]